MSGCREIAYRRDKKKLLDHSITDVEYPIEGSGMRQIDALLRFHFKIDPDLLDDDAWAKRWGELDWVLMKEREKWNS